MGRGHYPSRLKAPRLDPETVERYRMVWPNLLLHERPESFPPVTSLGLFGADGPLELDLGCGTGDFVCALAARRRDVFHLGIDSARKPLDHGVQTAAQMGLENVRFLHADAHLVARRLLPRSIANVYIHFPVPFRAARERKRRIYSPSMLSHLHRALSPGGRLSFITDDETAAREFRRAVESEGNLRYVPREEWRLEFTPELKSPYHKLWEERGHEIWRCELAP